MVAPANAAAKNAILPFNMRSLLSSKELHLHANTFVQRDKKGKRETLPLVWCGEYLSGKWPFCNGAALRRLVAGLSRAQKKDRGPATGEEGSP
jgi:hypothetical protein